MENAGGCQRQTKDSAETCCHGPGKKTVTKSASTLSRVQLGSPQEVKELDTPDKTLWNNRDTNENVKCNQLPLMYVSH